MKIIKEVTGSGEDVVIIHGCLANSDDMQGIVNELSAHYRVTNINSLGNGKSDIDDEVETIHDIADAMLSELPKSAIYIGWSKGGLTAQSIAARYPDRVKRIIGICTTPKFIADDNWIGVPAPGFESLIMPVIKDFGVRTLISNIYEAEFANINPKPLLFQSIQKICNNRPNISEANARKLTNIVDSTDLRKEFKAITCPIDLIVGEQDAAVPVEAFAQIQALNPRVKIHTISGAQHMPFATHEQEFNQILHKIL